MTQSTQPVIKLFLSMFMSTIAIVLFYSSLINPYNRLVIGNIGNLLAINGTHTYALALVLMPPIYYSLMGASYIKILASFVIYPAIHEFIWMIFDIITYSANLLIYASQTEFLITFTIWTVICVIALYKHMIIINSKTVFLFSIFIAFNLYWAIGYGYINTMMIDITSINIHPYAFDFTANAFEWIYNILFTAIFIVVYKWKN